MVGEPIPEDVKPLKKKPIGLVYGKEASFWRVRVFKLVQWLSSIINFVPSITQGDIYIDSQKKRVGNECVLCFGDVPAAIAKFTQKMNCVKYFDKLLNIYLQILKNVITQGKITGLERSSLYRIRTMNTDCKF